MKAEAQVLNPFAEAWSALARHRLVVSQLVLVLAVVHTYEIEGGAFSKVMTLAAVGFVVSIVLPLAQRLPFFVVLSIAGIVWVLGPIDGGYLLALGCALIGIAHLPVAMIYRVVTLVLVAAALSALRAGMGSTPWSSALWPILGSMFMFRMVLYVHALSTGQAKAGLWGALAYFFMLPNVAFPLFPVVDYQTFRRTHFDRDDSAIYEQGMLWITRGLVHLVLYRFVYYYVLTDPADVAGLGDLVQIMLGTFLLYLRVSGQFHLIVGLLHLFGFRLPETHKLYYLAHGFTELWRRINIYWTDFMMKVVFYPAYFKLKRLGATMALVLSTAAVFFATWILHSYQWFWLRGGFPITVPDLLFWGLLGALVILAGLKELKGKTTARQRAAGWSASRGLRAVATFCVFCFLWSLWSSESLGQWLWMLGSVANVDTRGIVLLSVVCVTLLALGGWNWQKETPGIPKWLAFARKPSTRTFAPLLVLLLIAQPALQGVASEQVTAALHSLQTARLNARDAALQHRGYYEQLDMRGQLNALSAVPRAPADWESPAEAGIIRERRDHLLRDLNPSIDIIWNGNTFSTNAFGMRDKDYAAQKPVNTLRIALLGPSHVMGNGVSDDETFEHLVEERLNRESIDNNQHYEILNFGVDGYTLPQQLAILEDRVLGFSPDIVIVTQYQQGRTMTESYLQQIVLGDMELPYEPMQALLADAGLDSIDLSGIPVPYEWARAFAEWIGLDARMPQAELVGRVRRVSEQVNERAIATIAEVAESHGAETILLALNAVIENVPQEIPNLDAVQRAEVPVIDLFDVFPEENRATLRVAAWDDHPNSAGHRRIAERLYEELQPLLTSGREEILLDARTETSGGE